MAGCCFSRRAWGGMARRMISAAPGWSSPAGFPAGGRWPRQSGRRNVPRHSQIKSGAAPPPAGVHHLPGGQPGRCGPCACPGRVGHVGKAPVLLVQLGGRYPQIQQNSVGPGNAQLPQNPAQVLEIPMHQSDPGQIRRQPLRRRSQGGFIPVDADEPPGGQAPGPPARRAPPRLRCRLCRCPPAGRPGPGRSPQQHRNMVKLVHRLIASRAARRFSGVSISRS